MYFLLRSRPQSPVHSSPMPFGTLLYFKIVYFHIKSQSLYFHISAILLYCFSPNHVHSISTNVSYPSSCIFTDHMLNYTRSAVLSFSSILLIYSNSGHFVSCCWVKTAIILTAISSRGVLFCISPTYEVCSESIRNGIVVVVHWVVCVWNHSLHVCTCLSNSWHQLQVAAFAQLGVVGRGINTCVYVIAIFTTCESTEQRICFKFCFKFRKTATETYQLLQQDAMGRT
jgi:hypothetical protein